MITKSTTYSVTMCNTERELMLVVDLMGFFTAAPNYLHPQAEAGRLW
jgi:hypothetical protein